MNFENLVVLQGRLTKDPELKSFGGQGDSSGKYVHFTLAVNRNYTDKHTGQRETDFLYCVAWGHSAEILCKYGFKGKKVGITGSLRSSSYTDKDTGKKMSKMEISVESIGFPESKAAEQARANERQQQYNSQQYGGANGAYYNNGYNNADASYANANNYNGQMPNQPQGNGYNAFPQTDPNNGYANNNAYNNSYGNNGNNNSYDNNSYGYNNQAPSQPQPQGNDYNNFQGQGYAGNGNSQQMSSQPQRPQIQTEQGGYGDAGGYESTMPSQSPQEEPDPFYESNGSAVSTDDLPF